MAFIITMPADFKIGETRDCRINRQPARLTWRDKDHLVIEPGDVRQIVHIARDGGLICFACGDADGTLPHITTEADFADDSKPQ
jgi:hypothetical protein